LQSGKVDFENMCLYLRDLSPFRRFEVNQRNRIEIRREGWNNEIESAQKIDFGEIIQEEDYCWLGSNWQSISMI